MSRRILLVEDDRSLRETLMDALDLEGYTVTAAEDGNRGTDLAFSRHFDLIVLDLMLPGRGGLEILRDLRAQSLAVPVLLLTVRSDENDKVIGFELGADDYVTKPFGLRELLARVKALLRRAGTTPSDAKASRPTSSGAMSSGDRHAAAHGRFKIGEALVDLGSFRLSRGGEEYPLSPKEAGILRLLYEEAGRAVSRDRFLRELWGEDAAVTNRTIDTHVLHLRQKLEDDARAPRHLVTVHGVGYRLVVEGSGS